MLEDLEDNGWRLVAKLPQPDWQNCSRMNSLPKHQRDFSWSVDEVTLLLDDVDAAYDRQDQQYFLGLVVFIGDSASRSKSYWTANSD